MKYIKIALLIVLLTFPNISCAEEDDANFLAEKFLIVTRQKEQNAKMREMLKAQMTQQMKQIIQKEALDKEQQKSFEEYSHKMVNILIEETAWEKIKDRHIDIINSIYSDKELKSLIAFFESELGKIYVEKQQITMLKIGESSKASMQNVMRRVRELEQEMRTALGK